MVYNLKKKRNGSMTKIIYHFKICEILFITCLFNLYSLHTELNMCKREIKYFCIVFQKD